MSARPPALGQDPIGDVEDRAKSRSTARTLVLAERGEVDISIQIIPTARSQELLVYADSGSRYRSATIGLQGEQSQRVHTFRWRGSPEGDYEVVGVVLDDHGDGEVVVRSALKVVKR